MNRRDFVRNSLLFSSVSLLPRWVWSQAAEPQFFLQFYMSSGWDTTLITEAWNFKQQPDPSKIFIEYSADQTIPFGTSYVGPALSPLKNHFSRMTIFNGVMMSPIEVGHPSPEAFSVSGVSDGSEPSFVCQFTDLFYKDQSVSIIASKTIDTAGRFYKIATLENIKNISDYKGVGNFSPTAESAPPGLIINAYKNLGKTSQRLNSIAIENQEQIAKIESSDVQQVAKGFLTQMYPAAFISPTGNLDTHTNHKGEHIKSLTESFQQVAKYLDGLQSVKWKDTGKSLLDYTTVVISSDFTRTPALNVGGGKDHNPFSNSMIVLSPKFKSELIIGRSRLVEPKFSPIGVSSLVAVPLDPNTLNPVLSDRGTVMLTPSVIYGSLVDAYGKTDSISADQLKRSYKLKNLYT